MDNPTCVFWDYEADDGRGDWSTVGCYLVEASYDNVTCVCDHLTNFAVLMVNNWPGNMLLSTHSQHENSIILIQAMSDFKISQSIKESHLISDSKYIENTICAGE